MFPVRNDSRVIIEPPVPNAQRQAEWRERHPDKVRAYNARRRAFRRAGKAEARAAYARDWHEGSSDARSAAEQPLALPAPASPAIREPLLLPAPPIRLCLPAPVEQLPLFIRDERTPEPVLVEAAKREEPRQRRAA